eukprot:TRINITY_DN991_c0_g1_i1.p1 TRINITY_DN991_c0_g1~~TRINITY_DN991_c0_g1_i1.p1  ORF type:complete len:325 (-),score=86.07 TRINITY_DN991_c0_g1_i1:32-1006(-)
MSAVVTYPTLSPVYEEDENQLPTPPIAMVNGDGVEIDLNLLNNENLIHYNNILDDDKKSITDYILKKRSPGTLGVINMSLPLASPATPPLLPEDGNSSISSTPTEGSSFAPNDVVEVYSPEENEWIRASVNSAQTDKEIEVMFIHPKTGAFRMQTMRFTEGTIRRVEPADIREDEQKLSEAELGEMLAFLPGRVIEIQRNSGEWVRGRIMRVGKKAMLTRFVDKEKRIWEKVLPLNTRHIALLGTNLRKTQAKVEKDMKRERAAAAEKQQKRDGKTRKSPAAAADNKSRASSFENKSRSPAAADTKHHASRRGSVGSNSKPTRK